MLTQHGYQIVPDVILDVDVKRILEALAANQSADDDSARFREGKQFALRNLLQAVPTVRELAISKPLMNLIAPVLGEDAIPVRGILFDKSPGANWKVAWHQDLSIAVKYRQDVEGYGPWSIKAGVPHVQPPVGLLRSMLTIRLHLDDCGLENGPLQVLPGSHAEGVLSPSAIERWRAAQPPMPCVVGAGGAVLMRPLILHASSAAERPAHRRVVHVEYAAPRSLHPALEWFVA